MILTPTDRYLGPDASLVKLSTGPTHIDVSLPPGIEIPKDTKDTLKHPAASLDIPTIVLVHGVCSASGLFDPVIQAAGLRDRFRVVTYDIEGHGQSPICPETGDNDIDKLVKTLGQVIHYVGAEKVVLAGHSVGGVKTTSSASFASIP